MPESESQKVKEQEYIGIFDINKSGRPLTDEELFAIIEYMNGKQDRRAEAFKVANKKVKKEVKPQQPEEPTPPSSTKGTGKPKKRR